MTEGWLVVKRPVVLEVPLVLDSFYLISFLQFLLPFSRKRLRLRWIVDIGKGIRSSLEELCESRCYISVSGYLSQHLLLCHVLKIKWTTFVTTTTQMLPFASWCLLTSILTRDRFLLRLKRGFSPVHIWQCSHFVFHVVRFEVWACARAKTIKQGKSGAADDGKSVCSTPPPPPPPPPPLLYSFFHSFTLSSPLFVSARPTRAWKRPLRKR